MKKNDPLVSIIIPVYNGTNYMREAIESALHQTYKNIEVIVVNDGSTDNGESEKIALSYGNKIKYYYKKNGGVSTALNYGIEKMSGEYFSWLSHDDRYYPNKIEVQIKYLKENNLLDKKVITYTNYDVIDEDSNITNAMHFEYYDPKKYPEYAVLHGFISGTSLLIPKIAFEEHGVFNTKYRCIQDYLLFFEFMRTYDYIFIPECTNSTRVHAKQVTNCNPNVVKENNYLWTYMMKEFADERKIKLNGSLYKFYNGMYKYLNSIVIYPEAIEYAKKMCEKEVKKYEKNIIETYNKNSQQCINSIMNIYNKLLREKNVFLAEADIVNISDEMNYYIKELGIKKIIEILEKNVINIPKDLKKILKYLDDDFNGDTILRLTYIQKLKAIRSEGGWKMVYKTIKNKIIRSLLSNTVSRKILKIIKIARKIIFFIPKLIIKFILNS